MFSERTSVGLDVHARSIVGCGLDTVTGQALRRRVTPTVEGVTDWLAELPAPVAVAYEAGPTGFGLSRQLTRPAACSGLLVFYAGVLHLNAARPTFFIPRELARRAGLVAFTAA